MARRVAPFATCLIDALFPDAGRATVELLERQGQSVEARSSKPAAHALDEADAVITTCTLAIVQSGTIVLDGGSITRTASRRRGP
jgi:L-lactate utilization protein LutC